MLSAAQLLDELMGRDRNLAPDEKRCNVRWDDESVCRYYLCGFCPAELFTNTRSDLGKKLASWTKSSFFHFPSAQLSQESASS
uniref:LUC7-like 3 pre-mRNA splicing factor n=1 Tax=Labrus bergylta TaxID=56723 RepID=A0A3Q3EUC7_9LABR